MNVPYCCNAIQTWGLITGERIFWYCVCCKKTSETLIYNPKHIPKNEVYIEDTSYNYTYWTDLFRLDND